MSAAMRPSSSTLRVLRQRSAFAQRRFASSTTENAEKKAKETLAAAQKQAEKAWESASKYMGPLGERLGSLLGAYRAPVTYNLQVAKEVLKHIYVAERLQVPSVAEFKSAYSLFAQRAANPAYLRSLFSSGEWATVGIYGLEAYGIYKIGEIIGRRSLVGYNVQ
ncbi:hypothetical protein PENSPDRAFT_620979 [Peniophora sp. CONT]|nr:hypothetical protein PENSPDRAFT_620979 [Peniophora sp. CONT]